MKSQTYNKIKASSKYCEKKHEQYVDPENIVYDPYTSQVRVSGYAIRTIPMLAKSIENEGQEVPVTVVPNSPSPGKFLLKDGATRVEACKLLGIDVKVSTFHSETEFKGISDQAAPWFIFQCEQNNHLICTPTTKADMEAQISTMVSEGYLKTVCGRAFNPAGAAAEKVAWISESMSVLSDIYTNFSTTVVQGVLENQLYTQNPKSRYVNYTKKQDLDFFNRNNPYTSHPTSIKKIGDTFHADSGELIGYYRATNCNRLVKDVLAYSVNAKMKNPDLKVSISVHHSEIIKSDAEGIDGEIQRLVDKCREYNDGSERQGWGVKFFDYVVIYPQDRDKDNLNAVKRVVTL